MKLIVFILATLISLPALADRYVSGYTRSNGTYVRGHFRSDSNGTRNDNYSTRGNVNPYTGSYGTKPRDENYGNRSRKRSVSGW